MPDTLAQCIEREREAAEKMARCYALEWPEAQAAMDEYRAARAATDEAMKAVEALARAVLDMQAWSIVGSNFDPAVRVTDLVTLNRLRHLASKIIPGTQPTTTGGASTPIGEGGTLTTTGGASDE